MAKTLSYTNINPIPALTWNWLRLNRATLNADAPDLGGTISVTGISDGVTYTEDGAAVAKTLPAMQSGCGADADAVIASFSPVPSAITANKGKKIAVPVVLRFDAADGKSQVSQQVIVAEPDSSVTVIMLYTSQADANGFHALQTKLWAKERAHIHLVKVNLLGSKYIHLDDTAAFCEDSASVDVTQIELGGTKTYAGVGATLAGYQSSFKSDTAYHSRTTQFLDMNYAVWHKGAKTDTKMQVKGVVSDDAVKIYRGTIDFQRGCAGATGDEQEETLLLSPTAINKSIPMILCDEEDVSGTHGATIGRLSADELFYMQSRGISKEAAKQMMSRAKIAAVAHLIPDEKTVEEINTFLDKMER
ncbi:MAG: SufD family Fe-S cluster assembly protein [Treponema sp.]|nr:SufD family Fe-S cluster assembly protein [Treponema sp.]